MSHFLSTRHNLLQHFARFVNNKEWEPLTVEEVNSFFAEMDPSSTCPHGAMFERFLERYKQTYRGFLQLSLPAQDKLRRKYVWWLLVEARTRNRKCCKQLFLATIYHNYCGQTKSGRALNALTEYGVANSTNYKQKEQFTQYCREKNSTVLQNSVGTVFWVDNLVKKWKRNQKLNISLTNNETPKATPYPVACATVVGANFVASSSTPAFAFVWDSTKDKTPKAVFGKAVQERVLSLVEVERFSYFTSEVGLSVSVTPSDLYETEVTLTDVEPLFSSSNFLPLAVLPTRPDTVEGSLETLKTLREKGLYVRTTGKLIPPYIHVHAHWKKTTFQSGY